MDALHQTDPRGSRTPDLAVLRSKSGALPIELVGRGLNVRVQTPGDPWQGGDPRYQNGGLSIPNSPVDFGFFHYLPGSKITAYAQYQS